MKRYLYAIWFALTGILSSCDEAFEYSPYVIDFEEHEKDLTQKNIQALTTYIPSDTIFIALTGDSHRFYDQSERLVNKLNNEYNIDFLIHTGDFTDYGIPKQYEWSNKIFSNLTRPYFVVVGNHDLVSNGDVSYQEMFGVMNFSFIYNTVKFIFINTNSREYEFKANVPDINWLHQEVAPSNEFEKIILVFHTPPFDADFNSELEDDFMNELIQSNNILFATHGHLHSFSLSEPYNDGIKFINTSSVEKNEFVLVKVFNNEFTLDVISF